MTQLDFFVAGRWRNHQHVHNVLSGIRSLGFTAYCFIENSYTGDAVEFHPTDDIDATMKKMESLPQTHDFVKKIFDTDIQAERNAKHFVLVLPAGISGHIEAGIAYGLGKKCYAIGEVEKTETLYNIFEKIFPTIENFTEWLQQQKIIHQVADRVRMQMENEGSGHDWWHVYRVWNLAKHIGEKEKAHMFTVELTALLHDVADWKFHDGDETAGPKAAREILEKLGVEDSIIEHVGDIILHMSFKGAGVASKITTLEGKVVQDADRLDAIGAIGIARTFAYGGSKNRPMYDPAIKPTIHTTKEAYFTSASPTINHFYEKLLLLKDLMNTKTAHAIAESRHQYMEHFLEQFYQEWDGKR